MRRHRHNLTIPQHERLMTYLRERPVLEAIYAFKQRLCYLLLKKHQNRKKCQQLAHRFLWHVSDPVVAGGAPRLDAKNYRLRVKVMCSRDQSEPLAPI